MAWASVAKWSIHDINLMNGDNTSVDTSHQTKEEALAAIRELKANGLGGRREIFPIEVFVCKVPENCKI